MTYPVGLPKRPLTFGPAFVMENGDPVEMTVSIKASRSLVWHATGSPLVTVQRTFSGAEGAEASLTLPATDQDGWSDGAGSLIVLEPGEHTHTYTAKITYTYDGGNVGTATVSPFTLPLGDGSPVDLDDLLVVSSTGGVAVSIPDTWSAQVAAAQQAAEDAAESAAEAAAGGGAPTYANLPAGSVITMYFDEGTGTWPARLSARADLTGHWVGGTTGTPPTGGVVGADLWFRESA